MNSNENPYASPTSVIELVPSGEPRTVSLGLILVVGATIGAVSFLFSIILVPSNVATAGEHDLRLANNLGFIYPPLVGLWAAWVRRSIPWAVLGVLSGLLGGAAYYALCGYDFLAVMVGFPCLLGGFTSVLLGTQHDSWIKGIPQRFLKGLFAGFLLGIVYAVLLNVIGAFLLPSFNPTVEQYSSMMWRSGTIALTVGSSLYFLLFHWSAGLSSKQTVANEG